MTPDCIYNKLPYHTQYHILHCTTATSQVPGNRQITCIRTTCRRSHSEKAYPDQTATQPRPAIVVADMDGPNTVRLQRRRSELPPDRLFVERRGGKRKEHPSVVDATRAYYIRQKRNTSISGPPSTQAESAVNSTDLPTASSIEARRTFHLKQPEPLPPSAEGSKSRKRKQNEASLPTVFEKRQRKFEEDAPTHHFDNEDSQTQTPSAPPKRPGRGSALRPQFKKPAPTKPEDDNVAHRQQREVQALAQEIHQFALE